MPRQKVSHANGAPATKHTRKPRKEIEVDLDEFSPELADPPAWETPSERKEFELARQRYYRNEADKGRLVRREEIEEHWKKVITEAKVRLETIPSRVVMLLTPDALREVADGNRDNAMLIAVVKQQVSEIVSDVLRMLQRGDPNGLEP